MMVRGRLKKIVSDSVFFLALLGTLFFTTLLIKYWFDKTSL
jgi:hypothetical protein